MGGPLIDAEAGRLAVACLAMLRRPYPHKLDHLILDPDDLRPPAEIHPVFSGCYDWHSSVHMHWSLLRLWRTCDATTAADIERHFGMHFTPERIARERAYAADPARVAFERPYGWAWLLKLQAQLDAQRDRAKAWAQALQPFAEDVAKRLVDFLARGRYPVRWGMHANSAFAMILARDYALCAGDTQLLHAIDDRARAWFWNDADYPARYEPSGADFLSPGLCEAMLMSRVLDDEFDAWWKRFDPTGAAIEHWLKPVDGSDRTDPQIVHLAGLNLSRAWCLQTLAARLPSSQRERFASAARALWQKSASSVFEGDFTATHWLLSFALLYDEAAVTARGSPNRPAA